MTILCIIFCALVRPVEHHWSPRALEKTLFKLKSRRTYQIGCLSQRLAEVLLGACIGGGPGVKPMGLLPLACLFSTWNVPLLKLVSVIDLAERCCGQSDMEGYVVKMVD
jgi:hypothetical protein